MTNIKMPKTLLIDFKNWCKAKAYAHDLKDENQSQKLIKDVINDFGGLNILVNNGGVQFPRDHFEDITPQQVKESFMTNILA